MKRILAIVLVLTIVMGLCACEKDYVRTMNTKQDVGDTLEVGNRLSANQSTPTDIKYSLERYNLTKRAYWVNGMEEKARSLPCPVTKPLGYVVLLAGNTAVARFVVDGKVSSLNSYLTPDSEYFEIAVGDSSATRLNKWVPDVDGSYGANDSGIFFFTVDGHYYEWSGDYLYSDEPISIADPVIHYTETEGNQ